MKPLQLTSHKFKYSTRLDKLVETKDDYIEELEMRYEESVDIWHLTNYQIYGNNGYFITITKLKRELKEAKDEITKLKKELNK